MPITIEHGGQSGSDAGQIVARAGQTELDRQHQEAMQIAQLQKQHEMQLQQIRSQYEMQERAAQHAFARTSVEHNLDGALRQQEYENQIGMIREQAQQEANQFEYKFTMADKRRIANANTAHSAIDADQSYSDDERSRAHELIDLDLSGISPRAFPRDPNKIRYGNGRGPQDVWQDEKSGAFVGLDRSGNPRVLISPPNTIDGIKLKQEAEAAKQMAMIKLAQQKSMQDMQKEMLKYRLKLAEDDMAVPDGFDEGGAAKYRPRTTKEIEELTSRAFGSMNLGSEPPNVPSGATPMDNGMIRGPDGSLWRKK